MKLFKVLWLLLVFVLVYSAAQLVEDQDLNLETSGARKDCDCGKYSTDCTYRDGKQVCTCQEYFEQNGTTCDRCDCRRHTVGCDFVNGEMTCICAIGYVQRDGICVDECSEIKPCQNGGTCNEGDCVCRNGIFGRLCTHVSDCDYDGICGTDNNVLCKYDVEKDQAYCVCKNDEQIFLKDERKCRSQCIDSKQCNYNGECINRTEGNFCSCKAGLDGDFCKVIDACPDLCGEESKVKCVYDEDQEKAKCVCKDPTKTFDSADKKCKSHCNETNPCRYKGECTNETDGNFCRCKAGFSGDFCEIVDECLDLCVTDYRAMCVYDENEGKANCVCPDPTMKFDSVDKKCKVICQNDSQCENGGECKRTGEYSFCRCKRGVSGDSCSYINDCYQCGYEDDVTCQYNVTTETAACTCENSEKQFDPVKKKCRVPCTSNVQCKNQAACAKGDRFLMQSDFDFCQCKADTSGDWCEIINKCLPEVKFCGDGDDVECVYDASLEFTYCLCLDKTKGFDGKVCQECNCGTKGNCSIVNGEKICKCENNYIIHDGKCVECNCGKFGKCSLIGGVKNCSCNDGYATYKGQCLECRKPEKCGPFGDCKFDDAGKKFCSCHPGYSFRFGWCTVCWIPATCGQNGSCKFDEDGEKFCACDPGYSLRFGKCKECWSPEKCGKYGACKFDAYGRKFCACDRGYSLRLGKCAACDCGAKGTCTFDGRGEKTCSCPRGSALNDGKCNEVCNPNPCKRGRCSFKDHAFSCRCDEGYTGKLCDQKEFGTNGKSNTGLKIAVGVIGGLLGVSAIVLGVCVIRKRLLRANARGLATNIRNSDQMAEIRRNAY